MPAGALVAKNIPRWGRKRDWVFRAFVRERIVAGENHFALIEGPALMEIADLNDTVHLNESGARHIGESPGKRAGF